MKRVRRDSEFEAVFDELFPAAQKVARRIVGDPALAEDIAAEALARTYARWKQVADLPYRNAWILKVAGNLAIDHVRRRRPRAETERNAAASDDTVATRVALGAALCALPKRQRQAITLRYLGDLTEAEVAEALGVSAGTVKTHLHRGLASLRGTLGTTFEEESLVAQL